MKPKCYISGKITGLPESVVINNFLDAENLIKNDFTPVNPIKFIPENLKDDTVKNWKEAMKICMTELIDCEAVVFMSNFTKSKGSMIEHYYAFKTHMKRIYINDNFNIVEVYE